MSYNRSSIRSSYWRATRESSIGCSYEQKLSERRMKQRPQQKVLVQTETRAEETRKGTEETRKGTEETRKGTEGGARCWKQLRGKQWRD